MKADHAKKTTKNDFDNEYVIHRSRYTQEEGIMKPRMDEIMAVCDFEGKNVLDLGGGAGNLERRLVEKNTVTLVDFSKEAIAIAKEICPQCRLVCADIMEYEPSGKFDVVILADVIEEIYPEQLEPLLQRIDKIAPEYLVVSTPTHVNYLDLSTHLVIYDKQELLDILAGHGWKLEADTSRSDCLVARFRHEGR